MGESPRLILCTPWFDCAAGGAERAFRDLAERFVSHGIEVQVYTTCSTSPYEDWVEHQVEPGEYRRDGLVVRRFPVTPDLSAYHAAVRAHGEGSTLTRGQRYDFFRSITSEDLIQALAVTVDEADAILCGPYFQALCHDVVASQPGRVSLLPAFHDEEPQYWEPVAELLQSARNVIYLSNAEKELSVRSHGAELGRRFEDWPVAGLPLDARPEVARQIRHDSPLVYVGRLDRGKGVPQLCDWHIAYAEEEVREGRSPRQLLLLGAGDFSCVTTSPYIECLGHVDEDHKAQVLSECLALVNLSPNESFSYVLMEAALSSVPTIVNQDCEVTSDHVFESGGGLAVQDASGYSKAVEYLASDAVNSAMGRSARDFVVERYHPDRVMDTFIRRLLS